MIHKESGHKMWFNSQNGNEVSVPGFDAAKQVRLLKNEKFGDDVFIVLDRSAD